MSDGNSKNTRPGDSEATGRSTSLGGSPIEGHQTSGGRRGPSTGESSEGDEGGEGRADATEGWGRLRRRPGQRIQEIDHSTALLEAFDKGDFDLAYTSAVQLQKEYRKLRRDMARLRFQLNFGSQECENCDGLHAGPNVVATCYQIQRCYFQNLRKGEVEGHQVQLLERLSSRDPA